jgi:hypothetical protein
MTLIHLQKSHPTQKRPGPNEFIAKFYQVLKEELKAILLQLCQEIERERTPLNSFYKVSITLILKSDKDTIETENYRPTSSMSIDTKILNKIVTNQIQQHIKKIIHHE